MPLFAARSLKAKSAARVSPNEQG